MILMGDRGIPDGYRHMHGYLGHTVKLINKKGEWVYCQFHMQSQQGVKFITQEDSANYSPDYSQKDLYESIEKGDFPEIEQICFNPAHMVPGIEPSADPVLQSRLYSYPDTHRHRVGVNYQQLPVNAPRVNYRMGNFQRDGAMAFLNQGSRPNYIS